MTSRPGISIIIGMVPVQVRLIQWAPPAGLGGPAPQDSNNNGIIPPPVLPPGSRGPLIGATAVSTGLLGVIAYYGIKAGVEEKGFIKVLGWVFGVPAALSGLVGMGTLSLLLFDPMLQEPPSGTEGPLA